MFTDIMATIDAELAIKVLKTYVKEFKSLSAAKTASGLLSMFDKDVALGIKCCLDREQQSIPTTADG